MMLKYKIVNRILRVGILHGPDGSQSFVADGGMAMVLHVKMRE